MASIYVHFPWCLAKCPYCDFVSYAAPPEAIDHAGYADAILQEAEARARWMGSRARPFQLSSIFFGGGTPSLWEPAELGRVLRGLLARFGGSSSSSPSPREVEVTVECNPTSLDAERAGALRDAGATRLSVGTQSTRTEQLKFLGRLHDPDGARRALEGALASGLRVSTDLIFGLPDQTPEDARAQAESLAGAGLQHLSCYQLTIEPGTQFGERRKRGLLPMADDGAVADAFLAIEDALEARGLRHYEISNYAAPGEEARHNLGYWRGDEYLGLGCAAFGFVRRDPPSQGGAAGPARGTRYRNPVDPRKYVERAASIGAGEAAPGEDDGLSIFAEDLDAEALLRERIMLGLRLREGLDLAQAARDLGTDGETPARAREIDKLIARGRLVRDGSVLRIPREAWLFADDVASRLF